MIIEAEKFPRSICTKQTGNPGESICIVLVKKTAGSSLKKNWYFSSGPKAGKD